MHRFANPGRFLRIAAVVQPIAVVVLVVSLVAGLYLALVGSPGDYQQGQSVRIMYVHVPSAWMAMFVYTVMAAASAAALIWRHPLAEVAAKASAPIGACFTFLALVTGALWGKPIWGTYWVWDARLTSVLVLFFLYLGYMALSEAFDDEQRGLRAASILALVGFVNVPIIKFSVEWWNTQHQPASVMKMGGPTIHASMLWPLLLMALAFKAYYVVVLLMRIRAELAARRVRAVRIARATAAS